eukprot:augustus_masked-scaffold_34-processed-gene-0.7-mRNA-1 protein AED:1.00 eAED:1.00 QI:0/0/0/0/1/1/2/0/221
MQPAPTVTNCNIITEDINEDDLRERLVYIANAQYCDLQNFNETHREFFSMVLVWFGHIVLEITRSARAGALKDSCTEYISTVIAGLELDEAVIVRPTSEEFFWLNAMSYGEGTVYSDLSTPQLELVAADLEKMGNVELYLQAGNHPHLLHTYIRQLKDVPRLSTRLGNHLKLANTLEEMLAEVPNQSAAEEEDDGNLNANGNLFDKGMEFLIKARTYGVLI